MLVFYFLVLSLLLCRHLPRPAPRGACPPCACSRPSLAAQMLLYGLCCSWFYSLVAGSCLLSVCGSASLGAAVAVVRSSRRAGSASRRLFVFVRVSRYGGYALPALFGDSLDSFGSAGSPSPPSLMTLCYSRAICSPFPPALGLARDFCGAFCLLSVVPLVPSCSFVVAKFLRVGVVCVGSWRFVRSLISSWCRSRRVLWPSPFLLGRGIAE